MVFLDHVLACFETLIVVLTNQEMKFFKAFDALYTKTLIDHLTTLTNHLETNGLIE